MNTAADVSAGRIALRQARWVDAEAAFAAALANGDCPEALDGLAEVRYRQGDYAGAIDLRERAYAGFRARGETRYPARLAAYHIAFDYAALYGNMAAARGWLERGRRLAAESGDCPERGWVELAGVLVAADLTERQDHAARAAEIARRFGDRDLEFDALAHTGVCLVECGQISEGMRLLDEAGAAARGGEVAHPAAIGEIYCKILLACELTLDVRRAQDWMQVATELGDHSNVVWVSAICRMYYGGILTFAGRWAEAERELEASIHLYDTSYRALRGASLVRLAELRVRQGRLDEAEQLLAGQEEDTFAVRPLARLHVARGTAELAATLLRRHLNHREGPFVAPELALLVEAAIAAGRLDEAKTVASRLTALGHDTAWPPVRAFAAFAAGLLCPDHEAVAHLEAALAQFGVLGLPIERARTRVQLARVLAPESPTVAVAEARVALDELDRIGASPDADVAAALLRELGAKGRTGPRLGGALSKRETEVLGLMRLGLTNPEIAARLFISRKTAAHHVSSVLAKLGVRNRAEAAAYAAGQLHAGR